MRIRGRKFLFSNNLRRSIGPRWTNWRGGQDQTPPRPTPPKKEAWRPFHSMKGVFRGAPRSETGHHAVGYSDRSECALLCQPLVKASAVADKITVLQLSCRNGSMIKPMDNRRLLFHLDPSPLSGKALAFGNLSSPWKKCSRPMSFQPDNADISALLSSGNISTGRSGQGSGHVYDGDDCTINS